MIAAWMLYTLVVTSLVLAATTVGEHVLRALRVPTRFAWLSAILVALTLSGRALLRSRASFPASFASDGTNWLRIDVLTFDRWNPALMVTWSTSSAFVLLWVLVSFRRLRLLSARLTPAVVANRPVLVSDDVGPALFGVLRTRIVVPRWVFDLSLREQALIVAHEREHAATFDPALMLASICLVALQPWNCALWLLVSRLRLAVEADCDRRVLRAAGDAHEYGRLLVTVYERMTPGLSAHVAFVKRASSLEQRVHRIASRPRLWSTRVAVSAIAAVVLVAAACHTAAPTRPALLGATRATAAERRVLARLSRLRTVIQNANR